MADPAQIVETITTYLQGVLTDAKPDAIVKADDLREFAGFDSLGILETLVWLESTFSITIPDEELVVDRFDSVAKMVDFVIARGQ
jgi:acyl carrier protein